MEQQLEHDQPRWGGQRQTQAPLRPQPDPGQGAPLLKKVVRGIRRRLHVLGQRYYIFSIDLPTYNWPAGLDRNLVIRPVTPDEFRAMADDPAFEITDYQLQNSLEIMAAGDQCWGAEVDGRIGSYAFVQFKDRFFSPKCRVPIAPATVYIFRAFTVAGMRGRGLAPAIVAWLALKFKAEGYTRILTDISRHNRSSLHYAGHAGYTRVGTFLESTLGRRRRVILCRRMRRVVSKGQA